MEVKEEIKKQGNKKMCDPWLNSSKAESERHAQSCLTPCHPMDSSPPGSSVHGILQARIPEWVAILFSRGIFPTQGSNTGLPHCRQILYQLSHKGSPRILEWIAYPFPSRSSWPRNWTGVSFIAGGFFTNWAIREDPIRKAQSKTLIIANASKGVGQQDSRHRWWDYKVEQPLWKTARQFLTN